MYSFLGHYDILISAIRRGPERTNTRRPARRRRGERRAVGDWW
jgi:hypothetical protein